ncbi:hypothetical protein HANVADRAFT_52060 [Hanseniaspora valbyensis NRRL Y-1626]|uniref:Telomere length regulation protein conserved domain-containing protein n=1 Tax=Hanseniaspora valbyensis NRRL Y-1626 TaxID=766949 RepID=A0A1B7TG29_9ASCO|nr:hypothetical protein HANVADRAFT_52060 [Hanseniaspora valbyensis NRRL Y-1626]
MILNKNGKNIIALGSSTSQINNNLIKNYDDVSIDDVLPNIDTLYNNDISLEDNNHLSNIMFLNKICFTDKIIYELLTEEYKNKIITILSNNFIFFNQFINNEDTKIISEILYKLIYENNKAFSNHYTNIINTTLDKRQLLATFKTLYFGSKIFNKLLDLKEVNIYNYVNRLFHLYYELVTTQGEAKEHYGDFLLHAIKLNAFIIMEQFFISNENNSIPFFVNKDHFTQIFINKIYKPSNTVTKKKITFEISKFLSKIANKYNYSTINYILKSLNPVFLDFERLLTYCKNEIFIFAYIKACSISHTKRLMNVLIIKWSNSATAVKKSYSSDDLLFTKLILICCNKLEKEDPLTSLESQFAHNSVFLNGVSKRLVNPLPMIVERTMIIARRITNNKVDYETKVEIEFFDGDIEDDKDFENLNVMDKLEEVENESKEILKLEDNVKQISLSSNEPLTNDINKRIFFIKDFLKQLLSVSSNSTNKLSCKEVLNEGCKLMNLKLKHKKTEELKFYVEELLPLLINIKETNENEDSEFLESYKIKCIICLIKAYPSKALDLLLENLFFKEFNIQQRLSILTSIGVGCLEIKNETSLPKNDNNTVLSENNNIKNDIFIHDDLMKKSQITWRSRKLDLKKQESTQKTRILRTENTMIIIKVCYSLIAGWLRGIDLGATFDRIFKEHYLRCLSLVYSLISDEKHLDPNRDLENGVKEVLVDAFKQDILIDKDTLKDTNLM